MAGRPVVFGSVAALLGVGGTLVPLALALASSSTPLQALTEMSMAVTCTSGQTRSCASRSDAPNCPGKQTCTCEWDPESHTNLCGWGLCSCDPALAETCNNCDDNCDGTIDNFSQNCTTSGGCANTQVCTAGVWGACSNTRPCSQSGCNGTSTCASSTWQACASCTPANPSCTNVCGAPGTQTCDANCALTACQSPEICNGCDDNRNGLVDDGITCSANACQ